MGEYINVVETFGCDVFNDSVMQARLPKKIYKELKKTIEEGKKIGDDRKYFWFQVRFRGLITLGVWKSAKNIQKLLKLASLRQ